MTKRLNKNLRKGIVIVLLLGCLIILSYLWLDEHFNSDATTEIDNIILDYTKQQAYQDVLLSSEQIHRLQDMLADPNDRPYWPTIATLIGMYSEDVNSARIIIDYFRRDDISPAGDVNQLKPEEIVALWKRTYQKMHSLMYLGLIGGQEAKQVLIAASTPEGAQELTSAWCNANGKVSDDGIKQLQYEALLGLALLNEADTDEILEEYYTTEIKRARDVGAVSRHLSRLIDAMAYKDCIKKLGGSRAFLKQSAERGSQGFLELLGPYVEKYFPNELCPALKNEEQ